MVVLRLLWQFFINFLNWLDHTGNFLALGDPDETISARVARARKCGVKWAINFCLFLTWCQVIVTFGKLRENHADYALDMKIKPNCREILDLCTWPPKLRHNPINEVMPEELHADSEV